jgi:hypothetical protein
MRGGASGVGVPGWGGTGMWGRHGGFGYVALRGIGVGGVAGIGVDGGSRVVWGVGGWGVHLSGANVDFLSARLLGALSWDVARSSGGSGGLAASLR